MLDSFAGRVPPSLRTVGGQILRMQASVVKLQAAVLLYLDNMGSNPEPLDRHHPTHAVGTLFLS